ncbi:MAG: RNA polymerase sigma factor [Cytophagales bacterium]
MTDAEYILGIKNNDNSKISAFVSAYSSRVYNVAISITQNKEDAEEVSQDVFVKIMKSISKFDEKSSLSTWVYRIATNTALDYLRKKKSRSWLSFSQIWSSEEEDSPSKEFAVDFVHPGVQLEQQENAKILFSLLEKLPERQKAAFVLNKLEDLSYKEIAQTLEITETTVDSLLSRAKANLKNLLKGKNILQL